MKKNVVMVLALLGTGCLNLEGVQLGGLESSPGKLTRFQCENGYKGSLKVRENGRSSLAFSDGKSSFVTYMQNVGSADFPVYVNDKQTLKWQHHHNQVQFTYPSPDYAQSGKLITTFCTAR